MQKFWYDCHWQSYYNSFIFVAPLWLISLVTILFSDKKVTSLHLRLQKAMPFRKKHHPCGWCFVFGMDYRVVLMPAFLSSMSHAPSMYMMPRARSYRP